ncbi:MAG TPA: hypothetical protein QF564_16325 [Pirellulaceae bacterium]|nr:hypothetical protein [Pirellulaceae bacterium]
MKSKWHPAAAEDGIPEAREPVWGYCDARQVRIVRCDSSGPIRKWFDVDGNQVSVLHSAVIETPEGT